jgi:hypothetical protein
VRPVCPAGGTTLAVVAQVGFRTGAFRTVIPDRARAFESGLEGPLHPPLFQQTLRVSCTLSALCSRVQTELESQDPLVRRVGKK